MAINTGRTSLRVAFRVALTALLYLSTSVVVAASRVELELITVGRGTLTGPQQWVEILKNVGFDRMRILAGRGNEKPSLEKRGTPTSTAYFVTGIITARNQLLLPGASFSARDGARIRQWVIDLVREGAVDANPKKLAFGLTSQQLVALHRICSVTVETKTRDNPLARSIQGIADQLPLTVKVATSAKVRLNSETYVTDELSGMSCGTALAALLSPFGLAWAPSRSTSGRVELHVTLAERASESWPVGWPLERKAIDVAPKLFERIEVEIVDTPLLEAFAAIGPRLGMPIVFDRAAFKRHDIELSDVRVKHPAGRASYKRIIDRLLAQAKSVAELRIDEADKPFIWITTAKRK